MVCFVRTPSEPTYDLVKHKFHPQQVIHGSDIPQPKRKAQHQPLHKKNTRDTDDALTDEAFGRVAAHR